MEKYSEIEEVEKVISKIRESRKEKGYSHEVMAVELGITRRHTTKSSEWNPSSL